MQDIYAIRAVSLSMDQTAVEGISKYTIKLYSPTQDTRTIYLGPVYLSIEFYSPENLYLRVFRKQGDKYQGILQVCILMRMRAGKITPTAMNENSYLLGPSNILNEVPNENPYRMK